MNRNHLFYGDDVIIISDNITDIQTMLEELQIDSEKIRLDTRY